MQRIEDPANIDLVRQIVQAHAYWRLKGLAVGLVIWNEERAGYRQGLQEQIMGLIAAGIEAGVTNRPGEIFVRPAEQISNEDRVLLQTVARAIISDSNFSAPIHAILPCSINMLAGWRKPPDSKSSTRTLRNKMRFGFAWGSSSRTGICLRSPAASG
jgi:hypothetical protein